MPKRSLYKIDFIQSSVNFREKWRGNYRGFPYNLFPPTYAVTSLSKSPARVVYSLSSMDLHWHIIITQVHSFHQHLLLMLYVSMSFGKCILTCIYRHKIIYSSFTDLKFLYALPIHPSLTPYHWKLLIFLLSPSFIFSRMFYSWNHKVRSLVRSISFTH